MKEACVYSPLRTTLSFLDGGISCVPTQYTPLSYNLLPLPLYHLESMFNHPTPPHISTRQTTFPRERESSSFSSVLGDVCSPHTAVQAKLDLVGKVPFPSQGNLELSPPPFSFSSHFHPKFCANPRKSTFFTSAVTGGKLLRIFEACFV